MTNPTNEKRTKSNFKKQEADPQIGKPNKVSVNKNKKLDENRDEFDIWKILAT